MLAIDTNIIVRLLTNDDHDQAARAKILIAENEVFVATSVLLETEWVLRGAYSQAKSDVIAALRAFAGLSTVKLEDPVRVETALTWAAGGHGFGRRSASGGRRGMRGVRDFRSAVGEIGVGRGRDRRSRAVTGRDGPTSSCWFQQRKRQVHKASRAAAPSRASASL